MREVAHVGVLAVQERGLPQQRVRLVVDVAIRGQEAPHHELRLAQAVDREQHVVEHREPWKQMGDLERPCHSERGTPMAGPGGDVLPEQQHLPRRGREDPGDQVEQRRLAGAVGTDDRLAFAGHDRKRDAAHGAQPAKALRQVSELEYRPAAIAAPVAAHAASSRLACPARAAARSAAAQMRNHGCFGTTTNRGPGSAAHRFALRCARDTRPAVIERP